MPLLLLDFRRHDLAACGWCDAVILQQLVQYGHAGEIAGTPDVRVDQGGVHEVVPVGLRPRVRSGGGSQMLPPSHGRLRPLDAVRQLWLLYRGLGQLDHLESMSRSRWSG